ncbi:hypothetical protein J6590_074219 [Homalodisca vitripennis]|nr:hypothetical protein J6590_074219 [Homalodisca vitripennis]
MWAEAIDLTFTGSVLVFLRQPSTVILAIIAICSTSTRVWNSGLMGVKGRGSLAVVTREVRVYGIASRIALSRSSAAVVVSCRSSSIDDEDW